MDLIYLYKKHKYLYQKHAFKAKLLHKLFLESPFENVHLNSVVGHTAGTKTDLSAKLRLKNL